RRAARARPGAVSEHGGARAASERDGAARDSDCGAWVHVNDVAGFIGPEVFRTREQLVRCCLEDIAMGKLHGLCIGLDVCSTLHMDVSLDDLDWCLDRILPANPAYLMALPTKIDPMLGYLTTAFQDHVRLREAFGYRVDDAIWAFFQQLGVVDANGRATDHFGNPRWIYLQYRRRKGDARSDAHILEEGAQQLEAVRARGLFIAEGHGARTWELRDSLQREVRRVYDDAKLSIWAELTREFIAAIPDALELATLSADRVDYVLHPATGEQLDGTSLAALQRLRAQQAGRIEVQIAISDGLNALAIMHDGHLAPFLEALRAALDGMRLAVAREHLVIESGRVRVGYRIGEALFAGLEGPRAILHAIGERPGSGHRTFSTYITALPGDAWGKPGSADHNRTKVVSGIAATALPPASAAREVARLLGELVATDP
ncbi:MAG TPA: ethanolamine ammonia-lyase subunit EutB, partial [Myxococcota bacterium]|nr:ethanolamine ammonia-lyase subunit EutB [Myxococcota bacterium]